MLSSSPSSYLTKPRSFTSLSPPIRLPRQSTAVAFQRRWATGEAEAKKDEEIPISEIQPTPAEEVENAIQSDNAADSAVDSEVQASEIAASEPVESEAPAEAEQSEVDSAVDSVKETASNAAEAVKETTRGAFGSATGAAPGFNPTRTDRGGPPREGTLIPKPTIYIGNLFFDVTENDLVKELARFGTIVKCRLMRDSRGLSKGYVSSLVESQHKLTSLRFGYVDFETTEAATKAIETLHQQLFEGRRLAVQYAAFESSKIGEGRRERSNKPLNPPSKTIFIGNMSFEMTDRDLNVLFRGIRNCTDVRVAIDRRTGQPRGFAHADFVDVKSAVEALKELQGKETYGRKLRVDYSYGPSTSPRNNPEE